ncbi:hypothetical protein SCUCBS95973_003345 [Sporothrix curviconia]|uniref:Uncharacterized protein n=1 Tax=Sporothrix curviconia TaxID=1260050 RepID=A0ABP0BEP8_9PEZI
MTRAGITITASIELVASSIGRRLRSSHTAFPRPAAFSPACATGLETNVSYFPPPCEIEKIVSLTIAFGEPLDGKANGMDLALLDQAAGYAARPHAPFYNNGGKAVHFYGEQYSSVPRGSSAYFYESACSIMYHNVQLLVIDFAYHQASIDLWKHDLNAFKMPV